MFDEYREDDDNVPPAGAPAWMVTFADLMSLLLCFFVLLLSFSTMDVARFRAIAESLQGALGAPAGTVLVAVPVETAAPVQTEPVLPEQPPVVAAEPVQPAESPAAEPLNLSVAERELALREQQDTEALAQQLAAALHAEIVANRIELIAEGRTITMRLREHGSFGSGEATLDPKAVAVLARIREHLAGTSGRIEVAGHTDNQPIETDRFRSNWELSAARAVSVAHELMADGSIPATRVAVSGHADTMPIASNDRDAERARNRRVEIVVRR